MLLHPPPNDLPAPPLRERILTLKQAAYRARVSTDTMTRWAIRHSIGHQIGGRGANWRIDAVALEMHLARDAEALAAYLDGRHTGPAVERYLAVAELHTPKPQCGVRA